MKTGRERERETRFNISTFDATSGTHIFCFSLFLPLPLSVLLLFLVFVLGDLARMHASVPRATRGVTQITRSLPSPNRLPHEDPAGDLGRYFIIQISTIVLYSSTKMRHRRRCGRYRTRNRGREETEISRATHTRALSLSFSHAALRSLPRAQP